MLYYFKGIKNMEKFEIKIKKNQKIRDFLLNYGFSKPITNQIIKNKDIKFDGKRLCEDDMVFAGQTVVVFAPEKPSARFSVIFEDENVIVLDKGCDIEVQGKDSLESAIPGSIAVHRLDRNTTGVMIMAKNEEAAEALKQAFKDKTVQKTYVCEVFGRPNFNGEVQKAYLVKDANRSEVKIYPNFVQKSVLIETKFKTVKVGEQTSLVTAELLTGRTHQIRAQLAYLGFPIIGDGKYGKNEINRKFKEKYQKLHCFSLKIKKINKKFEYLQNKEFISKPEWAKKYI